MTQLARKYRAEVIKSDKFQLQLNKATIKDIFLNLVTFL